MPDCERPKSGDAKAGKEYHNCHIESHGLLRAKDCIAGQPLRMEFAIALIAQRLFKLPLVESCSGHLYVVPSMGRRRKSSYRNRWIRSPNRRENGARARAFL